MRRWIAFGLLGIALLTFGPTSTRATEEIKYLRIGGGTIGGTWLLYAGKLVQIVEKEFPGIQASAIVGQGMANCAQIQNKNMEMGFTHTVTAEIAYNGKLPPTQPTRDVRHLMSLCDVERSRSADVSALDRIEDPAAERRCYYSPC